MVLRSAGVPGTGETESVRSYITLAIVVTRVVSTSGSGVTVDAALALGSSSWM
ncbi:MAG: hypothetical protein IPN77_25825 [Sandaracinaceae bacterium]|nr:hypothetical protein [Sandaracinaceae bacterium]